MILVYLLSAVLAFFSLYKALGSWKNVSTIVVRYPALLILRIVGYFVFDPTERALPQNFSGVAINWKWTFVNMAASFSLTTCFGLLDFNQSHQKALLLWVTDYSGPGCQNYFRGCTYSSYFLEIELGNIARGTTDPGY